MNSFHSFKSNTIVGMISYVFYIYYSFYIIIYFSDNIPSVRLSAWPLQGDIFDGDIAAGPVPTLFSLEPEATVQNIIDNLAKAHSDIQRLAKVFFLMESVLLADCPAILKKPRYNLPKGNCLFFFP